MIYWQRVKQKDRKKVKLVSKEKGKYELGKLSPGGKIHISNMRWPDLEWPEDIFTKLAWPMFNILWSVDRDQISWT